MHTPAPLPGPQAWCSPGCPFKVAVALPESVRPYEPFEVRITATGKRSIRPTDYSNIVVSFRNGDFMVLRVLQRGATDVRVAVSSAWRTASVILVGEPFGPRKTIALRVRISVGEAAESIPVVVSVNTWNRPDNPQRFKTWHQKHEIRVSTMSDE